MNTMTNNVEDEVAWPLFDYDCGLHNEVPHLGASHPLPAPPVVRSPTDYHLAMTEFYTIHGR